MKTLLRKAFSGFLFSMLLLPIGSAHAESQVTPEEATAIGIDAYVFGYPLITMEMTRRIMTNTSQPQANHAPMGQFFNSQTYPDASFRDVTAPNADTLYSTAWIDLSKEPYILGIPNENDRYYLMPLLDAWTTVFQVPGKRTTGTLAQKYAITGPGWKGTLPAGVTEYKSPTNLVWILGRTYCTGTPEDYQAVHALQKEYSLVPLSAYGKAYTPPSGKVDPSVDMKTPVRDQVNDMDVGTYFELMAKLMKQNPPTAADAAILARLAKLGIVPGRDFNIAHLAPEVAKALQAVPKLAQAQIMGQMKNAGSDVNGWTFSTKTGTYGTDYLQRAFITAIGLGANRPQDAIYPTAKVDATGKALDGAKKYTMHFAKDQIPPVNGFWSLTMYDANYFFVANPLNRYTLSSRFDFKYNPDGSLDFYIQKDSPGKDKESNWLPAPAGNFNLMLRLYWPKDSVINGTWKPPAVQPAV